ncbi:stage III sporulation protein AF [Carboxydothermus islandicus]|uniref:Stage III sporulation protein AF n=1 Tax=Carboxydothermus islandicus TaxID=661089 RepID=A0A1L8D3I4_9THEO|nr:stage III sporulation protein AF [Carboxydothermus islandicus]GAV25667.1 stage III sporulation protein AF [Carboxydothermus islandicus]
MEGLIKLAREIIFLLLLFTFLELLLPLGQIRNFTRAIIGLLLIMAMLTSLMELLHVNWNLAVFLPESQSKTVTVSQGSLLEKARSEAEKSLEAQIKALLNLNGGKVEEVEVKLGEGRVKEVTVYVKKPLEEGEKARFAEVLKAFFGIEKNINFKRVEVGQ